MSNQGQRNNKRYMNEWRNCDNGSEMEIVKVNSATLRYSARLFSRQQPPRLQLSNEPSFVPIGAVVPEIWPLTGAVKLWDFHYAPWVKEEVVEIWGGGEIGGVVGCGNLAWDCWEWREKYGKIGNGCMECWIVRG
ncbi:uncharacterized protein EI90DRAFT_3020058 [Cantharellus anzutake]|uniref:uncharacterized protein n=1 Tax=Cantharellus anzutake TaxID=1750568 RepID=UPI001906D6A1|nr:uncharacterized protein EI90DRAFT_3020058 [Cantharellus anzutake]KAF8322799.1 hypothetical protein EI90DRAFT_3020058 [Cantharellus anzutake]